MVKLYSNKSQKIVISIENYTKWGLGIELIELCKKKIMDMYPNKSVFQAEAHLVNLSEKWERGVWRDHPILVETVEELGDNARCIDESIKVCCCPIVEKLIPEYLEHPECIDIQIVDVLKHEKIVYDSDRLNIFRVKNVSNLLMNTIESKLDEKQKEELYSNEEFMTKMSTLHSSLNKLAELGKKNDR